MSRALKLTLLLSVFAVVGLLCIVSGCEKAPTEEPQAQCCDKAGTDECCKKAETEEAHEHAHDEDKPEAKCCDKAGTDECCQKTGAKAEETAESAESPKTE